MEITKKLRPMTALPGTSKSMLPPNCAESTEPGNRAPTLRAAMPCPSCSSENRRKFGGEIAIHFPGLKNLDRSHVYVCAEVAVCLDCGAAQFDIQEAELRLRLLCERDQHVPPRLGGPL
jgi:hypothetical protein